MSLLLKSLTSDMSISFKKLPLVHTTLLRNMESILNHKKLSPSPCKVFNKTLLYCFYGKPRYRSTENGTKQGIFPVAIFFKCPEKFSFIHNIFPFDSGAFPKNFYAPHICNTENIDNYSLGTDLSNADLFLNMFYSNYENYYFGKTKNIVSVSHSIELQNCLSLYNATQCQSDDRAKTVEVILTNDLELSSKNVEFIICPNSLRETFEKTDLSNKIAYYDTIALNPAQDYYGVINQITAYILFKKQSPIIPLSINYAV